MRTLIRLAIVAATCCAFPAVIVLAGQVFDLSTFKVVICALISVPASSAIAFCVANSFHRAAQTIAAATRFQAEHGRPTDHDTTGETR